MDVLLGAAAHVMVNHSSPDRRARRGADTQRVVYVRALLQVRRGGRTTTSMYCDTNVNKLLAHSTSNNYIWCLLPQPFMPACPMSCLCLCERSVCACLPYLLCLHRFEFADFCVRSARWACTRALTLCVHVHCYCVIYSEGVHARFSACGCMHISFLRYVTNAG